ncbi:hypothetical protein HRI96_04040 [Treponema parvum]|uniref:Uncharacterized protein n=1 Tax=Treponema parvum TaxID=138851 RepID=A0A975EZC3_9SPIR|nr:hypothetical protein [Treponema parvum]QTQ11440.1 hypothetical protein HRI96_04040 [Treponema parvum]QTQ16619.1 hypothetical protein HXT04_07905 [Treponema parvum]
MKKKYGLLLKIILDKVLLYLSNIFLVILYSFLIILFLIIGNKIIDIHILSDNNFFISLFSAIVGACIGLLGLRIQLSSDKRKNKYKHMYEKIIIPIDNNLESLITNLINYEFNMINSKMNKIIQPFDRKYYVEKNLKKRIDQINYFSKRNEELFEKISNNYKSSKSDEKEWISLGKIPIEDKNLIKKINCLTKKYNSNKNEYEINYMLLNKIKKCDFYLEIVKNSKTIETNLLEIKTYFDYLINWTKWYIC